MSVRSAALLEGLPHGSGEGLHLFGGENRFELLSHVLSNLLEVLLNVGAAGSVVADLGEFRPSGRKEILHLLFLQVGQIELVQCLLDILEISSGGVWAARGRLVGGGRARGRLVRRGLVRGGLVIVPQTRVSQTPVWLTQPRTQVLIQSLHLVIGQDARQIQPNLFGNPPSI